MVDYLIAGLIWNPLSWTIIFRLVFATILTLVVVLILYKIV